MDGVLAFRRGELERAREQFSKAIERYAESQHLYAQVHLAMSYRGLGEVALRRGNFDDALIEAHRAIRICREHPRHTGTGFTLVRAHLLAAKASFSIGVASEARTELVEAERLLTERTGYAFVYLYEANQGIVAFELASTYALTGKMEVAMGWLERAWNYCWNDHHALCADPSFARMLEVPEIREFIGRCRSRSRHPAPDFIHEGASA
jgi:tetratricopeptide (TPR) repeat protein